MNHEEHVSQLKSEVRYIQEVAMSAGGCTLCLRGPAWGARQQAGSGAEPSGLLTCLYRAAV